MTAYDLEDASLSVAGGPGERIRSEKQCFNRACLALARPVSTQLAAEEDLGSGSGFRPRAISSVASYLRFTLSYSDTACG